MYKLTSLITSFARGEASRKVVETCLDRIADPSGEGNSTYLKVYAEQARRSSDAYDQQRKRGRAVPPFAGIPVSIKDLFDVAGDVTTAGSIALRDAPAAAQDAVAVARLKAAGFIPMGRTNMTEFAFSGLGLNPHYGTPRNPYDRRNGRIPGGSSSGAAISITDGMAAAALGTDTGGSCRIPAALCGLVGFKPTARRVPRDGTLSLSTSLDSIGSIAQTVECCATIDSVVAGEQPVAPAPYPLTGLRLAIPQTLALDSLEDDVSRSFESVVTLLSKAGALITDLRLEELAEIPSINSRGGPVAAEAYATHSPMIEGKGDLYDPRVISRILRGKEQSAAEYIQTLRARDALIQRVNALTMSFDALIMPTVPIVAPKIAELADEETYRTTNLTMLRNPTIANFLDRCSISLPYQGAGDFPASLMLIAPHGRDARLLTIARGIEDLLKAAEKGFTGSIRVPERKSSFHIMMPI